MHINAQQQQVWDFFSAPQNLALITPQYMKFNMVNCPAVEHIYTGMCIEYRVSPVLNIPLKWVTVIEDVVPLYSFIDMQLTGPYKEWRHYHKFTPKGDGILMEDEVHYELPLGFIGDIAHGLFVQKQLEGIFDYREQVVREIFKQ